MPKASKKRVKSVKVQDARRKQRRFSTSSTFMPTWVFLVGVIGCLLLGSGVFGLWIADPAVSYASYLVATGGLGLGVSLWFGQPPEVAVAVGDGGVAVDNGRQTLRLNWFQMRSIRARSGHLVIEGAGTTLKFLIGANKNACALLLKEAAERVPDVMDLDPEIARTLPDPKDVRGLKQDIEDDQVAGTRCAASKKLIQLEEEARLCPRCGQIYLQTHVPSSCVSCQQDLSSRTLRA